MSNDSNNQNGMISLGGLWLKKDKQGQYFMVGNLGFNGKILVFKNREKKNDNSPDYFIYLAPSADKPKPAEADPNEPPF